MPSFTLVASPSHEEDHECKFGRDGLFADGMGFRDIDNTSTYKYPL